LQIPLPAGFKFEFGSGGEVEQGEVSVLAPRLRVWYDFMSTSANTGSAGTVTLAFMEPPNVKPNLHVNVDVWGGLEVGQSMYEAGILDDLIEYVLTGFGPCSKKKQSGLTGWIADKLGTTIVAALDKFGKIGAGRPYVIAQQVSVDSLGERIAELEGMRAKLLEQEAQAAASVGTN